MQKIGMGLAGFFMTCAAASAGEWTPPTDAEWQRLPAFCLVKKRELDKTDPNAIRTGIAMIGQQFQNAHHFCFGLNFLNRYYAAPVGPKAGSNLAMAINELTYMADHLAPGSTLASDIYLYRGTAYALARKTSEALNDLRRAVEYGPKRERPYFAYADLLAETGQKGEALRIITEGLRHVPESRALQRRYLELGGKLPYPEPITPPATAVINQERPVRRSADTTAEQADVPLQALQEEERQQGSPSASVRSAPEKESGSSPYCRFCPDQP